jgi:hypothetical protein
VTGAELESSEESSGMGSEEGRGGVEQPEAMKSAGCGTSHVKWWWISTRSPLLHPPLPPPSLPPPSLLPPSLPPPSLPPPLLQHPKSQNARRRQQLGVWRTKQRGAIARVDGWMEWKESRIQQGSIAEFREEERSAVEQSHLRILFTPALLLFLLLIFA